MRLLYRKYNFLENSKNRILVKKIFLDKQKNTCLLIVDNEPKNLITTFRSKKICSLRGHILIVRSVRSSLRSQVWARLGRAIRSLRFALRSFWTSRFTLRSCALHIHLSLFLIIWYWSSNQFYNNITDDVNYTFSSSHSISFWI